MAKKSEELQARLIEAKAKLRNLQEEEREMDDRFLVLRSEIRGLSGGIGRPGLISSLELDLKNALMREQDQFLPHVVYRKEVGESRYVVTRVTAKRIYARPEGSLHEFWFEKSTGKAASTTFCTIDVDATIAEWERYRATNGFNPTYTV